jgi:hypothetical protein
MQEFLIMMGVLSGWIILNRWVLPRFGIQTCMSGCCSEHCSSLTHEPPKAETKDR